jgi:RsiW-degrading membrane proteinase PrsW (M82 family)
MKLSLQVESGSLAGQSYELETGFLTVGRSESCSVRFDPRSERIASKQHAFIEARPDGYYITDNNSTNGTLVNGNIVQTARLSDGDTVQFGKNGNTARVRISTNGPVAPEQFRQAEIQSFQQAVTAEPPNFQNSIANFALGSVEVKPEPPQSRNTGLYIGAGLLALLMVPLMLIVIGIFALSLSPVTAVIATVIAFTPAALYILPLMGLDRYDPEPFWLLALAFAWGAIVAVFVSFFVNTIFGGVITVASGSPALGDIASAVISAPVIEEGSKGFGVLLLLIFCRRFFDDILDGIVYAGVIALGFATVENVMYYGNGLNRAVYEYGFASQAVWSFLLLFALRGILSPFAHVMFTGVTGIGCGISRESHNWIVRIIMPVVGYIGAVILHSIWNALGIVITIAMYSLGLYPVCEGIGLGEENFSLCGFLTGYIFLEIPLFFILAGFAFYIMRRQRRILTEMLALDIARGLISNELGEIATSATKSTRWLLGGIFKGKYRARSRYLRAVGKLGLSYWHIQRATAAQGQTGSFQQNPLLREEVLRWRDKV